jgi:hypothetical protein
MPSKVERSGGSYPVTFYADGSGTAVQFSGAAGAILIVKEGGGTIELCTAEKPGGDVYPIIDSEARPCTLDVSAGSAYEFPHGVFAAEWIVVRGTDVEGVLCVKG